MGDTLDYLLVVICYFTLLNTILLLSTTKGDRAIVFAFSNIVCSVYVGTVVADSMGIW